MINTVKYKFLLRPDTSAKEGGKYIYLYANVNGRKTFVSTGSLVPIKSWIQPEQSVKAGVSDQRTINNKLAQIKIQINNLINQDACRNRQKCGCSSVSCERSGTGKSLGTAAIKKILR